MRLARAKHISFEEFTHTYHNDATGNFLIGVTTLMKKHGLTADYGGIPADVLAKAAARGTAVHEMLEAYDNGVSVVPADVYYGEDIVATASDMQANLDAYKKLGIPAFRSEYMVTDYDTTASFIDKVYDDCSLADVKTTSNIHAQSVAWQLSIYAYLFEKMNKSKKVPHIYVIHVRDGKAKQMELNRIPDEKIEALFLAEKEGRIYQDDEPIPDASLALNEYDIAELVNALDIIAQYEEMVKKQKEIASAIQDKLYQYMVDNNLDEMACETGKFTRRAESTRMTIDSARLKKECPEIAEKYSKTTLTKGCVIYKAN